MAQIILTGLEYPHKYVLPPRKTFPGAGGVQEGGQKAGEWGYSMYCGMSGILLSVARLRTPGQHLSSSPTHLCKLLSTTEAQSTAPYVSHITEIRCDFSIHQRKSTAHLCTRIEGGSCEGVKRSSSAIKITGTGEHAADVPCGGT